MYRNEFEITLKTNNLDRLFEILSNPITLIKKIINIKDLLQINFNKYKAKISGIMNLELEISKEVVRTSRSFMLRYLIRREAFPRLFCSIEIYGITRGESVDLKVIYERDINIFSFIYDLKDLNEEILKNILNEN